MAGRWLLHQVRTDKSLEQPGQEQSATNRIERPGSLPKPLGLSKESSPERITQIALGACLCDQAACRGILVPKRFQRSL